MAFKPSRSSTDLRIINWPGGFFAAPPLDLTERLWPFVVHLGTRLAGGDGRLPDSETGRVIESYSSIFKAAENHKVRRFESSDLRML